MTFPAQGMIWGARKRSPECIRADKLRAGGCKRRRPAAAQMYAAGAPMGPAAPLAAVGIALAGVYSHDLIYYVCYVHKRYLRDIKLHVGLTRSITVLFL